MARFEFDALRPFEKEIIREQLRARLVKTTPQREAEQQKQK
jgi:hypothetical protein